MARVSHLSNHCLIDRPTHFMAFEYRPRIVGMLLRGLYRIDPQMHFTPPMGLAWWALGVSRSNKNPNMCTLWGLGWEAGRLSEVSVLYADCRNYTGMIEALGADTVAGVMDNYFRNVFDIVVQYDGIVDKFMGDACLALFNVPARREDHVERAVAAAKELQEMLETLNAEQQMEANLGVGIAVSTGYALTGRIGSNHPSDYTAIGEVVNIAARLQEHAQSGQILVTEEVYHTLQPKSVDLTPEEYHLRGIGHPVTAYYLN